MLYTVRYTMLWFVRTWELVNAEANHVHNDRGLGDSVTATRVSEEQETRGSAFFTYPEIIHSEAWFGLSEAPVTHTGQ